MKAPPLLLVLFFRETLAFRHDQVLVGFLCVATIVCEVPVIFDTIVGIGDFRDVDTGEGDIFLRAVGTGDGGGGFGGVGWRSGGVI